MAIQTIILPKADDRYSFREKTEKDGSIACGKVIINNDNSVSFDSDDVNDGKAVAVTSDLLGGVYSTK